jgi:hypothetical protein
MLRIQGKKVLVSKFEFGGSFGVNLEVDFQEVENTPYLKLLVTFDMSFVMSFIHNFTANYYLI